MKIGIMTLWQSDCNYGQQLQCYALQKYLENAGHDVFLIRYGLYKDYIYKKNRLLKIFNLFKVISYLYRKARKMRKTLRIKDDARNFESFRSQYIRQSEIYYASYSDLLNQPPQADIYITGSDQVWGYEAIQKKILHAYFLDFGGKDVKRISYAASFGKKALFSELIGEISPLLKSFNNISVREKSGVEICKTCGILDAEWACDPVLLISISEYRNLFESIEQRIHEKYCFLYIAGRGDGFSIKKYNRWAKTRGLKLIYVTGNDAFNLYKKCYPSIPEWLSLVARAEYIITDSFHCSVFSLLFDKSFAVVPRTGADNGMNERFLSLFEIFNMKERFILNNDFSILDSKIDYNINVEFLNESFSFLENVNIGK
jgi:hypothetical protein